MRKQWILMAVIGFCLAIPTSYAGTMSNQCHGRLECDILSAVCNKFKGGYQETTGSAGGINGYCVVYW